MALPREVIRSPLAVSPLYKKIVFVQRVQTSTVLAEPVRKGQFEASKAIEDAPFATSNFFL